VFDQSLVAQLGHRTERLLDRNPGMWPVDQQQVDVLDAEAIQALLDGRDDVVAVRDFEWIGGTLAVTIENVSDRELSWVQVGADLFVAQTRIADAFASISDLPSRIRETATIQFFDVDGSICNTERMRLTTEVQYDRDGDDIRETLSRAEDHDAGPCGAPSTQSE